MKTIFIRLMALVLTALLGYIVGRVRASVFVNTCTKRSAFTSAYDWMNSRRLGDNESVAVGTTEGVYRGKVAYLDNYSEGGTVVLYDPEKKESAKATFDQVNASTLLIPGSQILWIAQERKNDDA